MPALPGVAEFERVGDHHTIKVDVRVIAATNLDLEEETRKGNFREDLYYRLNVVEVNLPPLRSRREDITQLIDHFLDRYNRENNRDLRKISRDVLNTLLRYPWPGNVRQLQNAMQQVVVLNDGTTVDYHMLPAPVISGKLEPETPSMATVSSITSPRQPAAQQAHMTRRQQIEPLWLTEKNTVEAAIEACDGNINQAAGLLEVAPSTLYRKLQSWKNLQA